MRWPIAAHFKAGAVDFTLQGGGRATSPSTACDSSSATRREPFHPGGKARTRVCPDPGPGARPPPLQDAEIYQSCVAHMVWDASSMVLHGASRTASAAGHGRGRCPTVDRAQAPSSAG